LGNGRKEVERIKSEISELMEKQSRKMDECKKLVGHKAPGYNMAFGGYIELEFLLEWINEEFNYE